MVRVLDRRILIPVVAVEVVSAALAWRDLSGRPDDAVRGPRRLWQGLMLANPGNSFLYWVAGRR